MGQRLFLEELQHLDDEKIEIESLIESVSEDSHDSEEAFMNGEDLILDRYVKCHYYTALLNAVECSIHLNGTSQRSVAMHN